jgi:hypothetical protein
MFISVLLIELFLLLFFSPLLFFQIIAGSKDSNKLEAWMFPQGLRNQLKEAKHR